MALTTLSCSASSRRSHSAASRWLSCGPASAPGVEVVGVGAVVPPARRRLREPFQRVLPDAVRALRSGRSRAVAEQAAVHQTPSRTSSASVAADRLGRLQRRTRRRRPPAAEERLFGRVEQVVAPGDACAQRLLAGRQVARAAGQQRQTAGRAGPASAAGGEQPRPGPRPARSRAAGRRAGGRSRRPWPAFVVGEREVAAARPGRVRRRAGPRRGRPASPRGRRRRSGSASGGTAYPCSPPRRSGARLVDQRRSARARRAAARDDRRAPRRPARSCRAPAAATFGREVDDELRRPASPSPDVRSAERAGERLADQLRVWSRGQRRRSATPSANAVAPAGRRPGARGGSCRRRPGPVSVTSGARAVGQQSVERGELGLAPDQGVARRRAAPAARRAVASRPHP